MENKLQPSDQCSIVVSSCDGYSDVWNPFFILFFKYFPDNPFPVYLIAESKTYDDPRVKNISIGEDKGWASNIKDALRRINTPYIIYLQEDYLLESPVDLKRLFLLIEYSIKNDIGHLRLDASLPPKKTIDPELMIGEIAKNSPYRVSLQAAIWKKDTLLKLIAEGESGWEMEAKGSERSNLIDDAFLSIMPGTEPIPYYATAIKKGRWFYDALKLCRREGIEVEIKRPVETLEKYKARLLRKKPFVGRWIKFYDKLSIKLKSIILRQP